MFSHHKPSILMKDRYHLFSTREDLCNHLEIIEF
jgi:hypothetical protein